MKRINARRVVLNLIRAYEEEDRLYQSLEDVAAEQRLVLLNGREPARLSTLLERQRRIAEDIGRIEAAIAPLREHWEQVRDAQTGAIPGLADALDTLLDGIADRIHTIVEIDRANSRAMLEETAAGL